MDREISKNIQIMSAAVVLILVGIVFYAISPKYISKPDQVFCTQDAKICPDGSAVGRTGPKCEFAACPGATSTMAR